ncbi:LacI family transcriptional regulator [Stenotrophomonas maltophilia]|uniref:LacI family DNA-binding transcriptional regulator n=1 Tax=Stenotrophomonas chelatiphaga TaxID=517011 RepID=UPI000F4C2CB6|nr:LacI family DNA-binding transcriptional regulator [Stenotrophomonas chelatiphaga]MCS4229421.1 LacI family transcriptional regulator [Stenotrophomonas chelatiphaga]ROQ46129.1 LacI family transcriptional regulator [Stenotrophomonas maltophilia]
MTPAAPSRSARTPRLAQVAELAGVSESTVDRVLNERGSVSDSMRLRVIAAARQLELRRVLPSVHHGVLHIDVVMSNVNTPHYQRLEAALMSQVQMLGTRVSLHRMFWDEKDEAALIRFLEHPPHPRAGLLAFVRDVPPIRLALRHVQAQGIPVVTVTSDVTQIAPHPYAGIDNFKAGRAAGYLVGRFTHRPGSVLLYVASTDFGDHRERVAGFRKVIHERFPHLDVREPVAHHDQPDMAHASLDELLRQRDDVVAIYDTGSAAAGIAKALRRRAPTPMPVWITHEATREHAELMARGKIAAVIDQDPEAQAIQALQYILHQRGELDSPPPAGPTRFRIITPEDVDPGELLA